MFQGCSASSRNVPASKSKVRVHGHSIHKPHGRFFVYSWMVSAIPPSALVSLGTRPMTKLCWYNSVTSTWKLEPVDYQAWIDSGSCLEELLNGVISINHNQH